MEFDAMITACGLDCGACPVYRATRNGDIEQKTQVARDWSTSSQPLSPEDIWCDSCMTAGVQFQFCRICAIRLCNTERGLRDCAHCPEFVCAKLEGHWKSFHASRARETLLEIRTQWGIA
jgi:hypothetical protein